jgi:hypothetical protein
MDLTWPEFFALFDYMPELDESRQMFAAFAAALGGKRG